ncbi:hypothetical protein FB645_000363 [Coemansia sp. IMI 203386]|nr:hypothetical protein FB645_000363 [Coemansia sp. IMI 203386]
MTPESTSDSANSSYATGLSLMSDFRYPVVNLNPDASVGCQDELTFMCKSTAESAAAAAATTSMYPQDIADIFKPRFTTSEYPSELVFCSTSAASSGLAVQAPGSLEEMQALASMPGYGTGEMGFSAATLAMAAATAASSTPALLASEGVVSPERCCGAGYSTAMVGSMVTSDACNGPVLGSGTMNGPAGMQPMSSGHSQLPYQIYAPAPLANSTPLMSFGDGQAAFAFGCSSSAQAPVPVSAPATGAAFCTPIMGSAQQQPADQLFGKLDYAAVSNSAAAGLLGFAAGSVVGHGADAAAAARLGSHGVPSLAHTPQPDRSERPSPMALLGAYAVSPLTAASASPMVPAMASPMISSYFDGISLSSLSTPHMPTAYPAAARVCQGSCAVRPRLFRSLSTAGAHSRARSSSPSHLALGPGARAAGHPYLVHAHTTAGSETRAGHSKRASVHVDGVLNIARRLSIENAGCSPLNKAACASMSHAGSVISSGSCPAADADSAEDNDDDNDEAADKQQTSVSGRIPLTNEQREVFFRWLYENAHDPKPKGHERDRLRCIGNMSRERFKTWFANARRRYFVTSQDNGVLTYSVNQRFLVACQRAKIKLD